VVVLHHYSGLSLGEIAEILSLPYGTVGSRLHHAIRALRAAVAAGDRSTALNGQPA
jgi:DNA-directed RNA polymerase specialized sigma24 family protein